MTAPIHLKDCYAAQQSLTGQWGDMHPAPSLVREQWVMLCLSIQWAVRPHPLHLAVLTGWALTLCIWPSTPYGTTCGPHAGPWEGLGKASKNTEGWCTGNESFSNWKGRAWEKWEVGLAGDRVSGHKRVSAEQPWWGSEMGDMTYIQCWFYFLTKSKVMELWAPLKLQINFFLDKYEEAHFTQRFLINEPGEIGLKWWDGTSKPGDDYPNTGNDSGHSSSFTWPRALCAHTY